MSHRKLIPIMALALLSALAASAPAAQASHPDDTMADVACVLNPNQVAGAAALAGENGVNSVFQDTGFGLGWDLPELMDTDPGHFNFGGTATCEGADEASEGEVGPPLIKNPGPQTLPPGEYEIIASGDFDNLICGTGTANGDAVIRGPDYDPSTGDPEVQIFTEFSIKFNGGVGGGTTPPFTGKLVFVVDADETGGPAVGGQWPTEPDGEETWAGSDMGVAGPTRPGNEYPKHGGHSYAVIDDNGGDPPPPNGNQIDGGGGTGDITITPIPDPQTGEGGHCIERPPVDPDPEAGNVRAFLVNGQFEGFLSGEGSDVSQPKLGQPATNLDSDG